MCYQYQEEVGKLKLLQTCYSNNYKMNISLVRNVVQSVYLLILLKCTVCSCGLWDILAVSWCEVRDDLDLSDHREICDTRPDLLA